MYLKKIILNSLTTLIGNSISRVAFIVLSIISANSLYSGDFQNVTIMMSTVNMIVSSFGFAVGITIVKAGVEFHLKNRQEDVRAYQYVVYNVIIWSVILLVCGLVFSQIIAKKLYGGGLFITFSFILISFLAFYYTVFSYILISVESFTVLSKNKAFYGIVFILIIFLIKYFGSLDYNLYYFVMALMLFYLSGIIPFSRFYKNNFQGVRIKSIKLVSGDINYLKKIALPALLSNGVYSLAVWYQIIMVMYLTNDRGMTAEVATGMIWFNALSYLPQIVSTVILPMLSRRPDLKKHILQYGIVINLLSTLLLVIVVLLFKDKIGDLYSSQFKSLSELIVLLSIAAIPNALCKVTGQFFISELKMNLTIYFNTIWALSYISMTYLMLRNDFGIMSIAYSLIISYFLLLIIQLTYIKITNDK